jgi:glycosyltransferase involved in cell wall biosynthesis
VILAWLASRTCLSTGAMGVADMITDGIGEIIAPENDPAALAGALRRYMDDPERLAREGAAARDRAISTYDAPVVAERIERLFREAGAQ